MMIQLIYNFFKNVWLRFLLKFHIPKLGQVQIDIIESNNIQQPIKKEYDQLDIIEAEWADTFQKAFDPNNSIKNELIDGEYFTEQTPTRPDNEILNEQVRKFYKDYSSKIKRQSETFTSTSTKYAQNKD